MIKKESTTSTLIECGQLPSMLNDLKINFPTDLSSIEERITQISPLKYSQTRNYKNGSLTYLGPYISRGVISTKQVYEHIKQLQLPWYQTKKLIQELAWREYYQQVWISKGEQIHTDLKNSQYPIINYEVPAAVLSAQTGISAIDEGIKKLYQTGYMHNHMRMYVASLCCNIAKSHWLQPAKWMYSNLLDGDLASNHLSWQWVAGTFSNKKYYANQENINRYFDSLQNSTFLDVGYDKFESLEVPDNLTTTQPFLEETELPKVREVQLKRNRLTFIYNYYNIDPYWHKSKKEVQRIFLLEPSFFSRYPVTQKCLDFALELVKMIGDVTVCIGEFNDIKNQIPTNNLVYKEHPTNRHYVGTQEPRDWMTNLTGYYSSFSSFWKKCQGYLRT